MSFGGPGLVELHLDILVLLFKQGQLFGYVGDELIFLLPHYFKLFELGFDVLLVLFLGLFDTLLVVVDQLLNLLVFLLYFAVELGMQLLPPLAFPHLLFCEGEYLCDVSPEQVLVVEVEVQDGGSQQGLLEGLLIDLTVELVEEDLGEGLQ